MRYIDLHTHVLFDVDHGIQSHEDYSRMICLYREAGFDTVVFTPHQNHPLVRTREENIPSSFETAGEEAKSMGITTYLSRELYVEDQLDVKVRPLNGIYVLVEFNPDRRPVHLEQKLERLEDEGYELIIAHIERYKWLSPKSDDIRMFMNHGCWLQVNVKGIEDKSAKPYLKKGLVHIIASDNHGDETLPSRLRRALDDNPDVLQRMQNLEL